MRKRIPYISQLGIMDCGSACLTMIFNYYGVKVDIVDVGSEVYIGRDGMSLAIMKEVAEKYGFKFGAYKYEYQKENLIAMLPVILCSENHYVIVERKNKNNQYVIIDPAKGRYKSSFDEIQKKYKDILVSITPDNPIKTVNRKSMDIQIPKKSLIIVGILMLFIQLITLGVPIIVQNVVDGVSIGKQLDARVVISIIVLIVVSYLGLSWTRQILLLNIDMQLFKNIVYRMINKLFKIDISFFEWHAAGDIGNRFNNINQLNDIITNGIVNIFIQTITSVICFFAMLYISLKLTIYTVLIAIVQMCLLSILNKKNMTKTTQYIYAQSVLQSELVDTLNNMIEIKCMGMTDIVSSNLKEKYNNQIKNFKEKTFISNFMNCFISTISLVFPLIIYLIGSFSVLNGETSIGTLIAYVTLSSYFTAPLTTIVLMLPNINSIKEVMLRYKEIMNYQQCVDSGIKIQGDFHKIDVQNISYSYSGGSSVAVENITLDIKRGEHIALVGESGSGKSTLIKAILGVVNIKKGKICINGIDINDISKEQIYNWFAIVTQNPMCLNSTIRKNVDITGQFCDEEIWRALELAEMKKEVEEMRLGLDTVVGERGQNISGGQKQRLAIARALIMNTEVVIFDEATSNLDSITEKKICDNLKKSNKTQITVTHRLASIQNVDTIYVLNRGKLIEKGTHEELMKNKGWYYESIYNCGKI